MTGSYEAFLDRAAARLGVSGSRLLLARNGAAAVTGWADGWDQILVNEVPGSRAVYAFTRPRGCDPAELTKRFDRLAAGLARSGLMQSGAPLDLIAVWVFDDGRVDERSLTRLSPSVYYQGLRPASWAVDLAAGKVWTGRRLGRPAAAEELQDAAQQPATAATGVDLAAMQETQARQLQAFYRLMQSRPPVVTYALIAVNVILFLLLYLNGGPSSDSALLAFGALSGRLVEEGQWWRLFTVMFVHGSVQHILFNMVSLLAVGSLAERLYGSLKFLAIYLGAGLAGSLASFAISVMANNLDGLSVGASGAIFGVAGALLTVRYQRSDVIPLSMRQRITSWMVPLVVLNLVFSVVTPHIDVGAHLGGLVAGALLSFAFPLMRSLPESAGRLGQ